jgi:hypothetical protein
MTDPRNFHYEAYGLHIDSALELPELGNARAVPPGVPLAGLVTVRLGKVLGTLEGGKRVSKECVVNGDMALVDVPRVGRFLIQQGAEVLVEPDLATVERDLRHVLLGIALGVLLLQREQVALHASAISTPLGSGSDKEEVCIAFAGQSRAGKSTVAAWFVRRGNLLVSDDVCALDLGRGEGAPVTPKVWPGSTKINLDRPSLETVGLTDSPRESLADPRSRFAVSVPSSEQRSTRLQCLYVITSVRPCPTESSIRQLKGHEAVQAVMTNLHGASYLPCFGLVQRYFGHCFALLEGLDVYSVQLQRGLDVLDGQLEAVERHILGQVRV